MNKTSEAQTHTHEMADSWWGHPKIPWNFNLRLSEQHHNKLEFIISNSRQKSMHKMLSGVLDQFINEKLAMLHAAGIFPDQSQR